MYINKHFKNIFIIKTLGKIIPDDYDHRQLYEQVYVGGLFDSIAHRYDLLNHILSFGIDVFWRRKAIRLLRPLSPKSILDVATGTGDFAIEASLLKPSKIVGIDVSTKMLEIAKKKVTSHNLENIITFKLGKAEQLDFDSFSFDAVISAFGVRNFENLESGLKETLRVLRKSGIALILEFSHPHQFIFKHIYRFYFRFILPFIGGLISNNRSAYNYLESTVSEFPYGQKFSDILINAGFKSVKYYSYTAGIVSVYVATKE